MALVRYGNGVSEILGSIAGNVFSRNRGGAYIRNRTKPINAPTEPQSIWRNQFAETMQRFSLLDPSVQQGWNVLAESLTRKNKLGENYTPTGVQTFMELNLNLAAAGGSIKDNAPIAEPDTAPVVEPASLEIEMGETNGELVLLTANAVIANEVTGRIIIEASVPYATRHSSTSVKYRSIANEVAFSNANIFSAYTAVYGTLAGVTGASCWFRLRAVDSNGFGGPWLYKYVSIAVVTP